MPVIIGRREAHLGAHLDSILSASLLLLLLLLLLFLAITPVFLPFAGIVLGSAEKDTARLPHQKIGAHRQIGQFVRHARRLKTFDCAFNPRSPQPLGVSRLSCGTAPEATSRCTVLRARCTHLSGRPAYCPRGLAGDKQGEFRKTLMSSSRSTVRWIWANLRALAGASRGLPKPSTSLPTSSSPM
jgi:hypothetical protein